VVTQDTSSFAIFAELGWRFSDRLEATAGLRYTQDEKDSDLALIVGPVISAFTGAASASQSPSQTFEDVSPSVTLTYRVGEDARIYGRVASGFRAGGVNVLISDPTEFTFNEENSVNYEIGVKTKAFGGTTSFNVAAFVFDQNDVLLGVAPTPLQFAILNAGEAQTVGLEIDLTTRPVEGLTIGAALGWYDSEYTSVNAGVLTATEGSQIAHTPDWTFSGLVSYERPLTANLDWEMNAEVRSRNGGFQDGTETTPMDDFTLLNLSIGLQGPHWGISLFGDNVTDDQYEITRTGPLLASTVSPPNFTPGVISQEGAIYGVRLSARN
jgi:iron complex outermembrane receptor protein